ncbi:MAG: hypothetical protein V1835_06905 [Candidatus Micrarchaeota archaeon]
MRGLTSFVFLLAMLFPLAYLLGGMTAAEREIGKNANQLIRLNSVHSAELEVKNAFSMTLGHCGSGLNGRDKADACALRLIVLEAGMEAKYRNEGVALDLWSGASDDFELGQMKDAVFSQKHPLKCASCFDFSKPTIDYAKKPALLSSAFIYDQGGKMIISKMALPALPEALIAGFAANEIYFGASAYFPSERAAAVFLMPEGFG